MKELEAEIELLQRQSESEAQFLARVKLVVTDFFDLFNMICRQLHRNNNAGVSERKVNVESSINEKCSEC